MKKMFSLCLLLLCMMTSMPVFSQLSEVKDEGFEGKNLKSLHADSEWYKLMQHEQPNIFDVQKAYDSYFATKPFEKSKETRAFEFWKKHIVANNYDAQGFVGKPNANYNDLKLIQSSGGRAKVKGMAVAANWSRVLVRPDVNATWQGGSYTQGTCNMLAINPSNSNEMIAAFIDGGTLWRTTDNCATWTQVATNLLMRDFGSVVYCKSDPLVVYAGSRQGVIKSVDGGATWQVTGYDQRAAYPGGEKVWAMEVKANDPNTAVFAVKNVFYRTTNGGTTWSTSTIATDIRDLRALPSDPNVLFMTVKNGSMYEVRRSTNFGQTWAKITTGYPASIPGFTGELALVAVTPAAPKSVWVHLICKKTATGVAKTYNVYKSVDGGLSFKSLYNSTDTIDLSQNYWQNTWNEAFAVSDTDSLLMASGSFGVYVTRNGGTSWTKSIAENGKFYVHSDLHCFVIKGNTIWAAGDGGIQRSTDFGVSYEEHLDDGIQSQSLWSFDQGWKSDIMVTGMYHGTTNIRDDAVYNGWYPAYGADAGTAFINTSDDRFIYAHPYYSEANTVFRYIRSSNKTVAPSYIRIPYIANGLDKMNDPDYYERIYGASGNKIMISNDNAVSFTANIGFDAASVTDYLVALTNNKIAYARFSNTIMRTEDGGVTWENASPTSISGGQPISHLAIDGANPFVVWVTFGEKQSVIKVAKSTDGGRTWVNYSGNQLPSYKVNCIASQMGTDGVVYIGTDAGVYYRNNSMSEWEAYNSNLPLATHVKWLKINYSKAKLRLAGETGIWESDLATSSMPVAHPSTPSAETQVGKSIPMVDMSVCLANASYSWAFPDGTPTSSTSEKPSVTYTTGGDKQVILTVTDANGTDTRTYSKFIRVRSVLNVPKNTWVVKYSDSQTSTAQSAAKAIDGLASTLWCSAGSVALNYPHDIQIDMGVATSIESFKYLPRQDGSTIGQVKEYEWYVSNDGVNWGSAVATGTFSAGLTEKLVTLVEPVTARYFRFRPLSSLDGTKYASAAEIGIVGSNSVIAGFKANATLVKPGTGIQFSNTSAGNPSSLEWSFPGGNPSSSTDENPMVTYANPGIYPVTLSVKSINGGDVIQKNSFITVSNYVPQAGWTVKYVDSEESKTEKSPATNLFDGSINTFWGTDWEVTNPPCPHEVQIDMGANYTVTGFTYVPRQDGVNGRIKNYEFSLSTDGTNWELVKSGTFPNTTAEQAITFDQKTVRYFKMKALSEVNGNNWTTIAEIKLPFIISNPSGVKVANESTLPIYSYKREIKVELENVTNAKMQIFDVLGRELISKNISQGITSTVVPQKGIYVVRVCIENQHTVSKKVLVE